MSSVNNFKYQQGLIKEKRTLCGIQVNTAFDCDPGASSENAAYLQAINDQLQCLCANNVAFATKPIVCLGEKAQLIASGNEVRWKDSKGSIIGTEPTIFVEITELEINEFTAEIIDCDGCFVTEKVFIYGVTCCDESMSILGKTKVCLGDEIEFSGEDGYESYSWSGPNNFISSDQNIAFETATINETGIYTLTTRKDGCVFEESVFVSVELCCSLKDIDYWATRRVCVGDNIELKANGGTIFKWTGPDASTYTNQNETIVATIDHEGEWEVSIKDDLGCEQIEKFIVKVEVCCERNDISYDWTRKICSGDDVKIYAFGDNINPEVYYNSVLQTPVIDNDLVTWTLPGVTAPGSVDLFLNYDDCSTRKTLRFDVENCCDLSVDIAGTDQACIGQDVSLTATDIPGATYEWRSGGGGVLGNTKDLSVAATNDPLYVLTVIKDECSVEKSHSVNASNCVPTAMVDVMPALNSISNVAFSWTSRCGGVNTWNYSIKAVGAIAGQPGGSPEDTVLATLTTNVDTGIFNIVNQTGVDIAKAFSGNIPTPSLDLMKLDEDIKVCLIVEDDCGVSELAMDVAIVECAFDADILAPVAACEGTEITLTATATPGSTFVWNYDGSEIGTGNTVTHTTDLNGGLYTLDITRGGCTTSITHQVTVTPTTEVLGEESVCLSYPALSSSNVEGFKALSAQINNISTFSVVTPPSDAIERYLFEDAITVPGVGLVDLHLDVISYNTTDPTDSPLWYNEATTTNFCGATKATIDISSSFITLHLEPSSSALYERSVEMRITPVWPNDLSNCLFNLALTIGDIDASEFLKVDPANLIGYQIDSTTNLIVNGSLQFNGQSPADVGGTPETDDTTVLYYMGVQSVNFTLGTSNEAVCREFSILGPDQSPALDTVVPLGEYCFPGRRLTFCDRTELADTCGNSLLMAEEASDPNCCN